MFICYCTLKEIVVNYLYKALLNFLFSK